MPRNIDCTTSQVIDPVKKESVQSYFEPQKHALHSFVSTNKAKQNVRVPIPTTAKNDYFIFNSLSTNMSVNVLNTQEMNSKRKT